MSAGARQFLKSAFRAMTTRPGRRGARMFAISGCILATLSPAKSGETGPPPAPGSFLGSLIGSTKTPGKTDDFLPAAGERHNDVDYAWEVFTPLELASNPNSKTVRVPVWLRFLSSVPLDNGWQANFLAYGLFIDRWTTTYATKDAPRKTKHEAGRGDAGIQATFIHDINDRWNFGFGARLQAPTAGPGLFANTADAELGSGNWQIMPWFALRANLPEVSEGAFFAPTMRWTMSFTGSETRRRINEPQIRPTFRFNLSERWFVTLYPTYAVRVNFGGRVDGQTGRLFLPADALVGYRFSDRFEVSLQAAAPIVNQYPVFDLFTMLWFRGNF